MTKSSADSTLNNLLSFSMGIGIGAFLVKTLLDRENHPKKDDTSNHPTLITREEVIAQVKAARRLSKPVNLEGANLSGMDLSGLDLSGALFKRANLSYSNLTGTNLSYADLRFVNAKKAIFHYGTNLSGARIFEIKLGGASLPYYAFRPEKGKKHVLGDWEHAKVTNDVSDYHAARLAALTLKKHLDESGRLLEAILVHQMEQRIVRALINPFRKAKWEREHGRKFGLWRYIYYGARWLISLLSDLTTGFGESIGRIIITFFVFQAIFTYSYWVSGSILSNGQPIQDFFSAILFSLGAMTTTSISGLEPASQIVELFMTFQVVLGIAVTGLIGFVLGNRIRYSS